MTRSDLAGKIAERHPHLNDSDVGAAVKTILECMTQSLTGGERIEIRGFGSFATRQLPPRMCRNPKTGEVLFLDARRMVHFKPGKRLREHLKE